MKAALEWINAYGYRGPRCAPSLDLGKDALGTLDAYASAFERSIMEEARAV